MFIFGGSTMAGAFNNGRTRATRALASPDISVSQLEKALLDTLDDFGKDDLMLLLDSCGDQTEWRSKIQADKLKPMCGMLKHFAACCTNGVIPTKKLECSITNVNNKGRINWSDKGTEEFAFKSGTHHID